MDGLPIDPMMRTLKISVLLALSSLLFGLGCTLEVELVDISNPDNDFKLSSVLAETVGVADGITDLILTLELKNSNGSLVKFFTPQISLLSGSGVTSLGCSKSNELGISTCRFRSNTPTTALVSLENILIELTEEIVFEAPRVSLSYVQVVSSALNRVDAGGYTVTSHIGVPVQGLRQEVDGYEIFLNTTDGITPSQPGASAFRAPAGDE